MNDSTMTGGIYVLGVNDEIETLVETEYNSEDLLQILLAKYPRILAGDQINPSAPRRWLLIKREAEVPDTDGGAGRWSLDHLFIDQDGIPTLVEVKRSSDTRIRREVVGQMLDYAANAMAFWKIESIRTFFEQTCQKEGEPMEQALGAFLGEERSQDDFWQTVQTNMELGRLRLLFVADKIPEELRRVVEFLNKYMTPTEVLAVEIKQFVGGSSKTLVPRVIGQTVEAERRKGTVRKETRDWDEASFLEELEKQRSEADVALARTLFAWAKEHTHRLSFGQGVQLGSMMPVLDHGGHWHVPFCLWTNALVEMQFQWQATKPPFQNQERRKEFLRKLNGVPAIGLPADSYDRRPSIAFECLHEEATLNGFLSVMEWYLEEVKRS